MTAHAEATVGESPQDDGTERSIGAGESYTIPPGHDAWVEGSEPFVGIEVMGAEQYAKAQT